MYGIKGWSYVVLHAMVVSHSAGLSIKQFSCEDVEVFVQQHAAAVTGPPNSSHMLFFLHLPRTAGRTYHSCFLKTATPPSRRCEKSYDVLRLNASIPSCGLLSSHDDMSISKNLPEDTAYITQLRDPVDRVLSAYEFSTEVAARALHDPAPRHDPRATNTRNVWPWSGLVPWLEEELVLRSHRFKTQSERDTSHLLDPYNNSLILPLHEWIESPLVHKLVHNGQTMQVLGLTDYSQWEEAGSMRECLQSPAEEAQARRRQALALAIKRISHFAHVGVTEMLNESIASLAAILGLRMQGLAWQTTTPGAFEEDKATQGAREQLGKVQAELAAVRPQARKAHLEYLMPHDAPGRDVSALKAEADRLQARINALQEEQAPLQQQLASSASIPKQVKRDSAFQNKDPLWKAFRTCEARARARAKTRRANSLKRMEGLAFSREARQDIDPRTIARIRALNNMDLELHEAGRQLLLKRYNDQQAQGMLEILPSLLPHEYNKINPPDPPNLRPHLKQGQPHSRAAATSTPIKPEMHTELRA